MILEIRAAEGGEHAKRLVLDQFKMYVNRARRHCL
jgi:protein subunit release factor A